MAGKIARRWCPSCEQMVRADWSGANHILHLILSLVTFGLWLPVWFFVSLNGAYRCGLCGGSVAGHGPPMPRRRKDKAARTVGRFVVLGGFAALVGYGVITGNIQDWWSERGGIRSEQPSANVTVLAAGQHQEGSKIVSRVGTQSSKPRASQDTSSTAQHYVEQPAWIASSDVSKISDSRNQYLQVRSNEIIDCGWNRGAKITLFLACRENKTSLIVQTDCHMTSSEYTTHGTVDFRLDKDRSRKIKMTESETNKALGLWSGGTAIPVIKSMFGKSTLTVRATPYNENSFVATFPIKGLGKTIGPLRKACNW